MPKIQIQDIKVFYRVFYDGKEVESILPNKQVMIVLHGGPGVCDHHLYVDFWARFSSVCQVVFLDQRGNGQSDRGDPSKWNLSQCGNDIISVCDALKILHPIVAGISWGGYVAMSYVIQCAKDNPAYPLGLIFCNTEAKINPKLRKDAFASRGGDRAGIAAWELDMSPTKKGVLQAYAEHCLKYYAKKPYSLAEVRQCIVNIDMRMKFLIEENTQFDFRDGLQGVSAPVLLLAGRDDPAHPYQCAEETASCIPKHLSQLEIINGAGAPVYRDKSEVVESIINEYLRQCMLAEAKSEFRCGE